MTMYTHSILCDAKNVTVEANAQVTEVHGAVMGPVPNSITLIPLISTMVIIFGECSVSINIITSFRRSHTTGRYVYFIQCKIFIIFSRI